MYFAGGGGDAGPLFAFCSYFRDKCIQIFERELIITNDEGQIVV